MTYALINALSQIAVDENVIVGIILKIVFMAIAVDNERRFVPPLTASSGFTGG